MDAKSWVSFILRIAELIFLKFETVSGFLTVIIGLFILQVDSRNSSAAKRARTDGMQFFLNLFFLSNKLFSFKDLRELIHTKLAILHAFSIGSAFGLEVGNKLCAFSCR